MSQPLKSHIAVESPMSEHALRNATEVVIKVDLDERAFLFPQHKSVTQLLLHVVKPSLVRIEAAYLFNQNRSSPVLCELTAQEAGELSRRLVDAVYRAQGTQIVTPTLSLSISVVANGFIFQFSERDQPIELYVGTGSIWRVCAGMARAVDMLSPIKSN